VVFRDLTALRAAIAPKAVADTGEMVSAA